MRLVSQHMQIGAAYIRVSTDDQTEYSPEAQLNALREYAKKNDILLLDDYVYRDDGISGRKADKRPGFQAMIATAKKKPRPFDVILVHRFDRFARNREDSIVYKSLLRRECDIRVVSITEPLEDDKMSVLMEAMLEAMAEYYSLNLADEVKKGLFEKARRGENIGKPPYGYDLINSELIPNEQEAPIVQQIFEMAKTESLTKITQHLNMSQIPTKNRGRWTQTTIKYLLQNPIYYGFTRYNYRKAGEKKYQNPPEEWILAKSDHVPLIDLESFGIVQGQLDLLSRLHRRNSSEKYIKSWLQHLAVCDECGSPMTISSSQTNKYFSFRCCRNQLGTCKCGSVVSVKKLERLVFSCINHDRDDQSSMVIEKIKSTSNKNAIDDLRKSLSKIREKHDLVKKAYLAQVDSLDEYKKNKEQLKNEEHKILAQMQGLESSESQESHQIEIGGFVQLLESSDLTIEEKNKVAKQFIKEVRVNLKNKEARIIYYM